MMSIEHRPTRRGSPTLRRGAIVGCLMAGMMCLANAPGATALTFPIDFTPVAGSPFTETPRPRQVLFSPGGDFLATNSTTGFAVQKVSTAGAVSASPSGSVTAMTCPSEGKPSIVTESDSIAFSPNGKVIAQVEQGQGSPGEGKGFLRTYSVPTSGAVTPDQCLTDIGAAPPGEGTLYADAFSPAAVGGVLAVTSTVTNSVYVFSVSEAGKVLPLPGSPLATGTKPVAVAFSPIGSGLPVLATANAGESSVSVFTVSSGTVAPVAGSAFSIGESPNALAFSPNGGLLATADAFAGDVSVLSLSFVGKPTQVPGSPFTTGHDPQSVAFGPGGDLLGDAETLGPSGYFGKNLSLFSASPAGALTPLSSSPLAGGSAPASIAFSPDGFLMADANSGAGTTSVFSYGSALFVSLPVDFATLVGEAFRSVRVGAAGTALTGLIDRALGEVGWSQARAVATVHLRFTRDRRVRTVSAIAETLALVVNNRTHRITISQHHPLRAGSYTVLVTATAAGGLRSIPQRLRLTIPVGAA